MLKTALSQNRAALRPAVWLFGGLTGSLLVSFACSNGTGGERPGKDDPDERDKGGAAGRLGAGGTGMGGSTAGQTSNGGSVATGGNQNRGGSPSGGSTSGGSTSSGGSGTGGSTPGASCGYKNQGRVLQVTPDIVLCMPPVQCLPET